MSLAILNGPLSYGLAGVNMQYTAHDGIPSGTITIRELTAGGALTGNSLDPITATSVTETSPGNGIVVFNVPGWPANGGKPFSLIGNIRVELS